MVAFCILHSVGDRDLDFVYRSMFGRVLGSDLNGSRAHELIRAVVLSITSLAMPRTQRFN